MSRYHIHPFYFPTTVVFVDDSASFLANLSLQLEESLAYRLFESPLAALESINSTNSRPSLNQTYFSSYRDVESLSGSSRVIDVNVDRIHREVYNEDRFREISVVVVDYAMPEMDGLEFCRHIQRPVKKILLTGRADEKLAVKAFNEGLIDRFIMKSDVMALASLNHALTELQHEYFFKLEESIADALAVGVDSPLHDAVLADFFKDLCRERRIVESYFCSNPDGFLMLDARGGGALLLIATEDELNAQYETAFDQGAPKLLLDRLKSGKFLPYFWQSQGYYHPSCVNWEQFVHPAAELRAENWYYYAVVENPPPLRLDTVFSYQSFLQEMDTQGRSKQSPPRFSSLRP